MNSAIRHEIFEGSKSMINLSLENPFKSLKCSRTSSFLLSFSFSQRALRLFFSPFSNQMPQGFGSLSQLPVNLLTNNDPSGET